MTLSTETAIAAGGARRRCLATRARGRAAATGGAAREESVESDMAERGSPGDGGAGATERRSSGGRTRSARVVWHGSRPRTQPLPTHPPTHHPSHRTLGRARRRRPGGGSALALPAQRQPRARARILLRAANIFPDLFFLFHLRFACDLTTRAPAARAAACRLADAAPWRAARRHRPPWPSAHVGPPRASGSPARAT